VGQREKKRERRRDSTGQDKIRQASERLIELKLEKATQDKTT
jgi:hypothetical protein